MQAKASQMSPTGKSMSGVENNKEPKTTPVKMRPEKRYIIAQTSKYDLNRIGLS